MLHGRVHLIRKKGRKFWYMRYRNVASGVELTRSTEKTGRRDAERVAGKWEAELEEKLFAPPGSMKWLDFRSLYQEQHLESLAESTDAKALTAFVAFERIVKPGRIGEITARRISAFQAKLRDEGRAESTIAGMLAHLRAALRWAVENEYLSEAPRFPKLKRAKTGAKARLMKGRPLTDAEFQVMLDAVPKVVDADRAPEWQRTIRGLWLSGLRLEESINLFWDQDDCLSIDLSGNRPMFRVRAESEKGNQDRVLPMSPEFAEFIKAVPEDERTGPVFHFPKSKNRGGDRPTLWWVSRVICDVGKAAGIVVDHRSDKFASAHDLRRSFGDRWALRVVPQVLMTLMRHSSIETTLRYYVAPEAQKTADVLWDAHLRESGDTSGDT